MEKDLRFAIKFVFVAIVIVPATWLWAMAIKYAIQFFEASGVLPVLAGILGTLSVTASMGMIALLLWGLISED